MPGPDIIFVITMSMSQGRKAGISTALGLCTGLIGHTMIAALGISLLIQSSEIAFRVLKYAGAAYLLYLAFIAFKERNDLIGAVRSDTISFKKLYIRGIFMNLLNPKVSLFFLAFLPQFVPQNSQYSSLIMVFLGLLFIVQALAVFFSVSTLAGLIGEKLLENVRFSKFMAYLKIGVFTVLGLNLIFDII